MKWKNRLTNYNFWISIISAVLLVLQAFKFEFNIANISEIVTAVLGLLVVIGIINDPTKELNNKTNNKNNNSKGEIEEMPSDTKNETDNQFVENDYQVLINKIGEDIKMRPNDKSKICVDILSLIGKIFSIEKDDDVIETKDDSLEKVPVMPMMYDEKVEDVIEPVTQSSINDVDVDIMVQDLNDDIASKEVENVTNADCDTLDTDVIATDLEVNESEIINPQNIAPNENIESSENDANEIIDLQSREIPVEITQAEENKDIESVPTSFNIVN